MERTISSTEITPTSSERIRSPGVIPVSSLIMIQMSEPCCRETFLGRLQILAMRWVDFQMLDNDLLVSIRDKFVNGGTIV